MLTLSLPRVARATVQPPSTGPTTSSSGTNTSLKNTSLNSELPVGIFRGRTSTPVACMSMTIVVMPLCLGASGSVRTVARPKAATWAPLVQTFWPLTSHPPSTRVAQVLTQGRGHPAGHLVVGAVLDESEDDPAGDPVGGSGDAVGLELLLDHQLLDRSRLTTPGPGPVGHDVAGLDQGVTLGRRVERADALGEGADGVGDGFGLGRQV